MPDYQDIYNDVFSTDSRYSLAENSPGLRGVIQATPELQMLTGRALDVGCGVGFVVEYLSSPAFNLMPFGVDVSDGAVTKALGRLKHLPGMQQRLFVMENQKLPFEDNSFALVTCFDVLEHLDERDIDATMQEIDRVLKPRGMFFGSVSCRPAGVVDKNGENLHRTIQSPDWWIAKIAPRRADYDGIRNQLSVWKSSPIFNGPDNKSKAKRNQPAGEDSLSTVANQNLPQEPPGKTPPKSSVSLYQEIYDDNPWYGDAEQGRCPGVRLLPEYRDWLIEPVMDLGCGRGQTVDHLIKAGFKADGIDQIKKHPDRRVGDITKWIDDLDEFNSVICIDCIEHLAEEQVLGLFENMKRVKRQAFSIHNGASNGTGHELHVNRQSFQEWAILIRKHFEIAAAIEITSEQMLYLTQSKPDIN
ncbi:MAG: methyltransferase domain-containing protein [Mariniblastus sp.]|nr:methyltransferase domain-containing protein [Mariniblastus sp.]